MNTIEQAISKMQRYVDGKNRDWKVNRGIFPDIIIYESQTKEYQSCWVFFWQVREIAEDHSNVIIGNGPILIEKESLDMYILGTGREIEEQVEHFSEDKDYFLHLEEDEYGYFEVVNR